MTQTTMAEAMMALLTMPKWTMAKRAQMKVVQTVMMTGDAAVLDPSRYHLAACPWNSTPCPHSGATTDYRPIKLRCWQ